MQKEFRPTIKSKESLNLFLEDLGATTRFEYSLNDLLNENESM